MKEKILSIEEVYNQKGKDGYKVTTNQHTYMILIENGQCCCEDWGYFTTNDDLKDFVGSSLIKMALVDIDNKVIEDIFNKKELFYYSDECSVKTRIQFVNFETSNGLLQFAVYNTHNGYYGHDILITKDDYVLQDDRL